MRGPGREVDTGATLLLLGPDGRPQGALQERPLHPLPTSDLVAMGTNRAGATRRPEHSSPAIWQPGPEAGESGLHWTICFWGCRRGANIHSAHKPDLGCHGRG